MSGAAAVIGAFLVASIFSPGIFLAFLAVFLITAAGNVINDYVDVESDRINRPKRPIPSMKISRKSALIFAIMLFAAGILTTVIINNVLCLIIALVNSLLLVAYSTHLQNKVLLGNLTVAYLASSTFLFGGAAAGDITLPLLLMLMAGLATFSREIVKDLQDLQGDRQSFLKKMTYRIKQSFGDRFRVDKSGIKLKYKTIYAILVASFSLWLAIIISIIPYSWGILGDIYLFLLVPTDAVFVFSSIILIKRRNYRFVSKLIKIGMALGLLAFLIGASF
ncbi:MAG: UbiA family prenyltransferase [Candidatus Aenigmatarchaeota archaeon]|nr:MAG: UbiA family prenyltransferase [Candidatus Aenigmarchaeota archaeon]